MNIIVGSIQVEGVQGIEGCSINSGSILGDGEIHLFSLENINSGSRNFEENQSIKLPAGE